MTTTATAIGTTQVYRVYIKAAPQAIWDAITNPEWTERFGYGGRADYDLRPGGRYIGYTTETFRMVMDPAMAAQGFTRVTYEIEERKNGVSRVTLTHELEGAPQLAVLMSGGLEDQGAGGGWHWVLSGLKTLLETGQSLDPAGHQ
jgi:uncharacterized protein YndB with AHSA1/START domain